jgi:hypothetical protein
MRTWTRVTVPTLCGGCNRELHRGDPLLVIEFVFLGGKPVRCWRCDRCEGPAPPDLPVLVEREHRITPTPLTRMLHVVPKRPLGVGLVDWRAKAAGERDPGEEG